MQENEAKPHNYKTDIEELKDAGANQVRNELVASNEESNKSLTDAISANTSAVVNLTKSIKGEQKKEDDSAENVVDTLADGSGGKSDAKDVAQQAYKNVKEGKQESTGFNPFSVKSLFGGWGKEVSSKESRNNADILVNAYHNHPKTKEEKEYRGIFLTIFSGIWKSIKGVVTGIGKLSTFVANSIFHPIETAKWIASALGSLLAPLAPVAATAIGIGGIIGIGTEMLTTRKQREGFLERRGAIKNEDGTYDLSNMNTVDQETARGLLDESGKLKSADKVDWGTAFRVAGANLADTFLPSVGSYITDKLVPWGMTLGKSIAESIGSVLGHVLYEYGDYLAEILPFVDSYAEKMEDASKDLVKSINAKFFKEHGEGKDHRGTAMVFDEGAITSKRTRSGYIKQSESFKDAMVDAAFSLATLNKSLPSNQGMYVSSDKVNSKGEHMSAFELFRTTEEFKKWRESTLKENKNGLVDITSVERSRLVELFKEFFEKKKADGSLVVYDSVPEITQTEVATSKAAQAKDSAPAQQQPQQSEQNNTTYNTSNSTVISYGTNPEIDLAWRAILQ